MFERILVPLDGSEPAMRALAVAQDLARPVHGTIILLEVVVPPFDWAPTVRAKSVEPEADPEEAALAGARQRLESVASGFVGLPVEVDVRSGHPAVAINQAATDHHCSLICLSAHGRGRAIARGTRTAPVPTPWMMGGVCSRVAHSAPTHVLIVRPEE